MKLNEEKLDQMVEVQIKEIFGSELPESSRVQYYRDCLRRANTPFCMELTDEEIEKKSPYDLEHGECWIEGAKCIRDGKTETTT